jgi:hypothetical protein
MTVAEAAKKAGYKGSLGPLSMLGLNENSKLSELPEWVRKQYGLNFKRGGRVA